MALFAGAAPPVSLQPGGPAETLYELTSEEDIQAALIAAGQPYPSPPFHAGSPSGYQSSHVGSPGAQTQEDESDGSASASHSGSLAQSSGTVPVGNLSRYVLGGVLGSGTFSTVFQAMDRVTGGSYALKKIERSMLGPQGWTNLQREIEIMAGVDHPNVLRLHEVLETDQHIFLVVDFMVGGELFNLISQRGQGFGERDASAIVTQILQGCGHLHSVGVAHRE
jgi:protein-serine/threonine kinase